MNLTNFSTLRLIALANFACLLIVGSAGCQTVTRTVERQPVAASTPVQMTAQQSVPSATQATILYARQLEQQDRVLEAANIYEQLLAEQGDIPVVIHRLAVINSQLGNFNAAETYFRKGISLDQHNAELLCDFGFNCFLQNRMIEAENSYLSALNINRDLKRLRNNLAVLYARTDRGDLAFEQFCAAGCNQETARENLQTVTIDQRNTPIVIPAPPQPLPRAPIPIPQPPVNESGMSYLQGFGGAPSIARGEA